MRLKDLAEIYGVRDNQLHGIGVVVGLSGTGDKTPATVRMLMQLLVRADAVKDWTGSICEVKSFSLTNGVGTLLSPTVGILTLTGSVDGECGGQKPPLVYGTSVYVKEADMWKWAFGFNSPN